MDEDDFTVTDETDGQPVAAQQAPAVDAVAVARETAKALMAELAPLLQQRAEPQVQAKPGDPMLDAIKQRFGIEDDEDVQRYAKAQAYRLLRDEYGDDPAVRKALDERIERARPIESVASVRREMIAMKQELLGELNKEREAKKRAEEAAAYKRLAAEGQLADKFPTLFRRGRPSQAALEIFDQFDDVESLRKALAIAEKVAAEQQPRKPQIVAGGGRATQSPKPTKFYDGADYDAQIRRIFENGEVN